ncbi:MAG: lipoyl(octanoyl) transferase LipB [Nitriliruptoraceae bacterium]|nr:lipoyl(octanoyl) transferase LipB [Nitriliruptoraceae bacterium]
MRAASESPLRVTWAGRVPYLDALALQRRLVAARRDERVGDTLLLLEHPPVYTLGKRADAANVLFDQAALTGHGIEVVEVDRGGDVTYHGPGQLVGYPILRLASLRGVIGYVRALEEVLIRTLATYDLDARRIEGLTGVWVGEEKVAAIGVRVASGAITSHGFALNVDPDLTHFTGIVPCGIADRGITSLARLGVSSDLDQVRTRLVATAGEVFAATLEHVDPARLEPPVVPTG